MLRVPEATSVCIDLGSVDEPATQREIGCFGNYSLILLEYHRLFPLFGGHESMKFNDLTWV